MRNCPRAFAHGSEGVEQRAAEIVVGGERPGSQRAVELCDVGGSVGPDLAQVEADLVTETLHRPEQLAGDPSGDLRDGSAQVVEPPLRVVAVRHAPEDGGDGCIRRRVDPQL